jgi:hypothetical protein
MPTYIQNQPSSQIIDPQKRVVWGAAKQNVSRPDAAHLGLTLDASISMRSLVDSAIEAVNRLLAEQKGINPQSRFTLTSFGHVVRPIIENIALADGPLIGRDLYRADGGSTSLNVRHP